MTSPRWYWLIRDRRAFIAKLVETGDAEQAAHSIGRTLGDAFLMREHVPDFAEEWRRAMEFVVEMLESRVIGQIMTVARTLKEDAAKTVIAAAKAVLDTLHKRKGKPPPAPRATAPPPPVDAPRVIALRAEIERLGNKYRPQPG